MYLLYWKVAGYLLNFSYGDILDSFSWAKSV